MKVKDLVEYLENFHDAAEVYFITYPCDYGSAHEMTFEDIKIDSEGNVYIDTFCN